MAKKDAAEQRASIFQTIGAAIAGIIAVKIVSYIAVALWRLATREDPPDLEEQQPLAKKALWIALIAAATGTARQLARDWIKPPTAGAA